MLKIIAILWIILGHITQTLETGSDDYNINLALASGCRTYRTMERCIQAIQANGTDAMIEVFQGLPHGFGLGTGTAAEGWIENAVTFWERNMEQ